LPNEYALSKWAGERQVRAFQRRHGIKATSLRFFNAYGPGEYPNAYRSVVALFCDKALRGLPLPVYEGYFRTFMYIDDFIPTLANACTANLKHNTYNIGGTDYRSVEELAEIVLKECGVYWPDGAISAVDLIPEDKHNTRNKRPLISRARRDLGHDPQVKLEEGVPATLGWMRDACNLQVTTS
jgi:dTDP-glucose 4,6-dehydratase